MAQYNKRNQNISKIILIVIPLIFIIGSSTIPLASSQINENQQASARTQAQPIPDSYYPLNQREGINLIKYGQYDDDGGSSQGIDIENYVAYVANREDGLEIINVSDPQNPVIIASFKTDGTAIDVCVYKNHAYVAIGGRGVDIIYVGDPHNPWRVSKINPGGYVIETVLRSNVLYFVTNFNGLFLYEVTDPAKPLLMSHWYDEQYMLTGLAVWGKFVCLSAGDDGMLLIDFTFPSDPYLLSSWDEPNGFGYGVDTIIHGSEHIVYLAFAEGGFRILNFTKPNNISKISEFHYSGTVRDVTVQGEIVYCCIYEFGISILNVSDKKHPKQIGKYYDSRGNCNDVDSYSTITISAEEHDGINIINTKDLSNPSLYTKFLDHGLAEDVIVRDNLAFVADRAGGFEIFNLSKPDDPTKVGQFMPINTHIVDISLEENLALLSAFNKGIFLVNISNPTNPKEISSFYNGHHIMSAISSNELVYIASLNNTVQIYNISDPANIFLVSEYVLPNSYSIALSLVLQDDYLFVGTSINGVLVFDVSNSSKIQQIGHYDDGGRSYDLEIVDNYLFVADYTDGLEILDISNVTNIQEIGQLDTDGFSTEINIVEDWVLIADGSNGMRVADISDIANPKEIGSYTKYRINGVAFYEQFIITGALENGLVILAIDSDGDSITDFDEIEIWGTDPFDQDTDGDQIPDGFEINYGLDPLDDQDGTEDPDQDGLSNREEYVSKTDPFNNDTDGDLLPDGYEISKNLNPLVANGNADPDDDWLTNYEEYVIGTEPLKKDTDGDGAIDGLEYLYQTDPLDGNDNPVNRRRKRFLIVALVGLVIGIISLILIIRQIRKRIQRNIQRERELQKEEEDKVLLF
ncbi:MAG: hypothetical protein GF308_08765 [Candidatus Heimdallarchaeota archaeon]|nr:hypothetical protein [Candidatus Heimdallarchaeota archaeon]